MSSSHLLLGIRNGLSTKIIYAFLVYPNIAKCADNRNLLDFTILTTLDNPYEY
jgi:hypothetical protein